VIGELPSIQDSIHTLQEPLAVSGVRKADVAWLMEEGWPSPAGEIGESALSLQSSARSLRVSGLVPDVRGCANDNKRDAARQGL